MITIWLVLGNKCEIYLFTKEMKTKYDIWHKETFHTIEYFQRKKGIQEDIWNLRVSVFKKYFLS